MYTRDVAVQEADDNQEREERQRVQDEDKEEEIQTSLSRPVSPLLRSERRSSEPQSVHEEGQPGVRKDSDSLGISSSECRTGFFEERRLARLFPFFPSSTFLLRTAHLVVSIIRCYFVYASLCFFCLVLLYSCFLPSLFIHGSRYNRVPSAFLAVDVPVNAPNAPPFYRLQRLLPASRMGSVASSLTRGRRLGYASGSTVLPVLFVHGHRGSFGQAGSLVELLRQQDLSARAPHDISFDVLPSLGDLSGLNIHFKSSGGRGLEDSSGKAERTEGEYLRRLLLDEIGSILGMKKRRSAPSAEANAKPESRTSRREVEIHVFAIDFGEEPSAFHPRMVDRQAAFILHCLEHIRDLYKLPTTSVSMPLHKERQLEASRASDADTASHILTGAIPLRRQVSSASADGVRQDLGDLRREEGRERAQSKHIINVSDGKTSSSHLAASRHLLETGNKDSASSPALVVIGHSMGGVAVLHALSRSGERCSYGRLSPPRSENDALFFRSGKGDVRGGSGPTPGMGKRERHFTGRSPSESVERPFSARPATWKPGDQRGYTLCRAFDFSMLPFLSVITVNSPILPLPALSLSPAVGAFQRKLARNLKRLFRTTRGPQGAGGQTPEAHHGASPELAGEPDTTRESSSSNKNMSEGSAKERGAIETRDSPGTFPSSRVRRGIPRENFAAILPPLTFLFTFSSGWQGGFVSPFVSSPLLSAPVTPPESPLARLTLARSEKDCPYHFLPTAGKGVPEKDMIVCYWPTLLHLSLDTPFLHGVFSGGDHVNILRSRPFLVFISSLLRWHGSLAESVRSVQHYVKTPGLEITLQNSFSSSSSSRYPDAPFPSFLDSSTAGPYGFSFVSSELQTYPLLRASYAAFSSVSFFLATLGQSLRFFFSLFPSSRILGSGKQLRNRILSSSHGSAPLVYSPLGTAHPVSLIQSQKYYTRRLLRQRGRIPLLNSRPYFYSVGDVGDTGRRAVAAPLSTKGTREDRTGRKQGAFTNVSSSFSLSSHQSAGGLHSLLGIPEFCRWIEEEEDGLESPVHGVRGSPVAEEENARIMREDGTTTGDAAQHREDGRINRVQANSRVGRGYEAEGSKRGSIGDNKETSVCTPRLWLWGLLLEKAALLIGGGKGEEGFHLQEEYWNSRSHDEPLLPRLERERDGDDVGESSSFWEYKGKVSEPGQKRERGKHGEVLSLVDEDVMDHWNSCSICSKGQTNGHREWYEAIFLKEGRGWGDACRRHLARVAWLRRDGGRETASSRAPVETRAKRWDADSGEGEVGEEEVPRSRGGAVRDHKDGGRTSGKERALRSDDNEESVSLHQKKSGVSEMRNVLVPSNDGVGALGSRVKTTQSGVQTKVVRGGSYVETEGGLATVSERVSGRAGEQNRGAQRRQGGMKLEHQNSQRETQKERRQLSERGTGKEQPARAERQGPKQNTRDEIEWDLAEWVGIQLASQIEALDEGSQTTMNDFVQIKLGSPCGKSVAVGAAAEKNVGEVSEERGDRSGTRTNTDAKETTVSNGKERLAGHPEGGEKQRKGDDGGLYVRGRLDTSGTTGFLPSNRPPTLKKEEAQGGTVVSIASVGGWLSPRFSSVPDSTKDQTLETSGEHKNTRDDLRQNSRTLPKCASHLRSSVKFGSSSCFFASSLSASTLDEHSASLRGVVFLPAFTYPFPHFTSHLSIFPMSSSPQSGGSAVSTPSGSLSTVLSLSAHVPFQRKSRLVQTLGTDERPIIFDERDTPACTPPWPLLDSRAERKNICPGCAVEEGRRRVAVLGAGGLNEGKEGWKAEQQATREEGNWEREEGGEGVTQQEERQRRVRPRLSPVFQTFVNNNKRSRMRGARLSPQVLGGDPRYPNVLLSEVSVGLGSVEDPPLLVFVAVENWAEVSCDSADFSLLLRRPSHSELDPSRAGVYSSPSFSSSMGSPSIDKDRSGASPAQERPRFHDQSTQSKPSTQPKRSAAERESGSGETNGNEDSWSSLAGKGGEARERETPVKSVRKHATAAYCFYSLPPSVLPPLFYPVKLCSFLLPVFSLSRQSGGYLDSVCPTDFSSPPSAYSFSGSSNAAFPASPAAAKARVGGTVDAGLDPGLLSFRRSNELRANGWIEGEQKGSTEALAENAQRESEIMTEDAKEQGVLGQGELPGTQSEREERREPREKPKGRITNLTADQLPPLFYAVVLPHLLEPPMSDFFQDGDSVGKETDNRKADGPERTALHAFSGLGQGREQEAAVPVGEVLTPSMEKVVKLDNRKNLPLKERAPATGGPSRTSTRISSDSSLQDPASTTTEPSPGPAENATSGVTPGASSAGSGLYQLTSSLSNSPAICRFAFARSWLSPFLPDDPASSPFASFFFSLFVPLRVKMPLTPTLGNPLFFPLSDDKTRTEKTRSSAAVFPPSITGSPPSLGAPHSASFSPSLHMDNLTGSSPEDTPSLLAAPPVFLLLPAPPSAAYLLSYDVYVYVIPPALSASNTDRMVRAGDDRPLEKRKTASSSSPWPSRSRSEGITRDSSASSLRALMVAYESNPVWEILGPGLLSASSINSNREREDEADGILTEVKAANIKVHLNCIPAGTKRPSSAVPPPPPPQAKVPPQQKSPLFPFFVSLWNSCLQDVFSWILLPFSWLIGHELVPLLDRESVAEEYGDFFSPRFTFPAYKTSTDSSSSRPTQPLSSDAPPTSSQLPSSAAGSLSHLVPLRQGKIEGGLEGMNNEGMARSRWTIIEVMLSLLETTEKEIEEALEAHSLLSFQPLVAGDSLIMEDRSSDNPKRGHRQIPPSIFSSVPRVSPSADTFQAYHAEMYEDKAAGSSFFSVPGEGPSNRGGHGVAPDAPSLPTPSESGHASLAPPSYLSADMSWTFVVEIKPSFLAFIRCLLVSHIPLFAGLVCALLAYFLLLSFFAQLVLEKTGKTVGSLGRKKKERGSGSKTTRLFSKRREGSPARLVQQGDEAIRYVLSKASQDPSRKGGQVETAGGRFSLDRPAKEGVSFLRPISPSSSSSASASCCRPAPDSVGYCGSRRSSNTISGPGECRYSLRNSSSVGWIRNRIARFRRLLRQEPFRVHGEVERRSPYPLLAWEEDAGCLKVRQNVETEEGSGGISSSPDSLKQGQLSSCWLPNTPTTQTSPATVSTKATETHHCGTPRYAFSDSVLWERSSGIDCLPTCSRRRYFVSSFTSELGDRRFNLDREQRGEGIGERDELFCMGKRLPSSGVRSPSSVSHSSLGVERCTSVFKALPSLLLSLKHTDKQNSCRSLFFPLSLSSVSPSAHLVFGVLFFCLLRWLYEISQDDAHQHPCLNFLRSLVSPLPALWEKRALTPSSVQLSSGISGSTPASEASRPPSPAFFWGDRLPPLSLFPFFCLFVTALFFLLICMRMCYMIICFLQLCLFTPTYLLTLLCKRISHHIHQSLFSRPSFRRLLSTLQPPRQCPSCSSVCRCGRLFIQVWTTMAWCCFRTAVDWGSVVTLAICRWVRSVFSFVSENAVTRDIVSSVRRFSRFLKEILFLGSIGRRSSTVRRTANAPPSSENDAEPPVVRRDEHAVAQTSSSPQVSHTEGSSLLPWSRPVPSPLWCRLICVLANSRQLFSLIKKTMHQQRPLMRCCRSACVWVGVAGFCPLLAVPILLFRTLFLLVFRFPLLSWVRRQKEICPLRDTSEQQRERERCGICHDGFSSFPVTLSSSSEKPVNNTEVCRVDVKVRRGDGGDDREQLGACRVRGETKEAVTAKRHPENGFQENEGRAECEHAREDICPSECVFPRRPPSTQGQHKFLGVRREYAEKDLVGVKGELSYLLLSRSSTPSSDLSSPRAPAVLGDLPGPSSPSRHTPVGRPAWGNIGVQVQLLLILLAQQFALLLPLCFSVVWPLGCLFLQALQACGVERASSLSRAVACTPEDGDFRRALFPTTATELFFSSSRLSTSSPPVSSRASMFSSLRWDGYAEIQPLFLSFLSRGGSDDTLAPGSATTVFFSLLLPCALLVALLPRLLLAFKSVSPREVCDTDQGGERQGDRETNETEPGSDVYPPPPGRELSLWSFPGTPDGRREGEAVQERGKEGDEDDQSTGDWRRDPACVVQSKDESTEVSGEKEKATRFKGDHQEVSNLLAVPGCAGDMKLHKRSDEADRPETVSVRVLLVLVLFEAVFVVLFPLVGTSSLFHILALLATHLGLLTTFVSVLVLWVSSPTPPQPVEVTT
ncbi:hypothetical protein CSUI_002280 [Cystoisospora suis]|uniref:GPI inositol-deacylase PGAP1-like alpha/beta domain-containing protein n=1 Tax=Cystoisospora suis TaxID=483139 RepID=A0A2C6L8P8_9APIC|nr:hypothetical protein CSUI_002280 [Cystoisospora suis]